MDALPDSCCLMRVVAFITTADLGRQVSSHYAPHAAVFKVAISD
jgi:hypothetical protein